MMCLLFFTTSCSSGEDVDKLQAPDPIGGTGGGNQPSDGHYVLPEYTAPNHDPGIAIYTADMGKNRSTEVNSEWVTRSSQYTKVSSEIIRNGYNAMQKISFEGINKESDYFEFVVALYGKLVNPVPVPGAFLQNLSGVSFKAVSYDVSITLTLEAYSINGDLIKSEDFEVTAKEMKSFIMSINDQNLHHLVFKIEGKNQDLSTFKKGAIGIDDIYLENGNTQPFQPPVDDEQLLEWLKKSSINYFLWNYKDLGDGRGVVLESADEPSRVSLSGMGYAYAIYILAEDGHLMNSQQVRDRIFAMLKWQQSQNWFDGSGGIYGFPLHYYNANGTGLFQNNAAAISTVDWAICAAGLRAVRQRYASEDDMVQLCNELLDRPQWGKVIYNDANDSYKYGRISKGMNAATGQKNGQVWGDAFSEETELVYLEALASGEANNLDLNRIVREKKNGYYVSWFGAGFTYNWMQLWIGPVEPYKTNSTNAFTMDATASQSRFGKPLMGLTACGTLSNLENNGFVNWDNYISNQGSFVSGANQSEVIQESPAPYGTTLALPFVPSKALEALRAYVALGYFHPLLGLPDNIRINNLPQNLNTPVPNWNPYDINIGSMALAIDQYKQNIISQYYRSDPDINNSLQNLIQSF